MWDPRFSDASRCHVEERYCGFQPTLRKQTDPGHRDSRSSLTSISLPLSTFMLIGRARKIAAPDASALLDPVSPGVGADGLGSHSYRLRNRAVLAA